MYVVDKAGYFVNRKCPTCGKVFKTVGTDWGYTSNQETNLKAPLYFCSYSCLRTYERPRILAHKLSLGLEVSV